MRNAAKMCDMNLTAIALSNRRSDPAGKIPCIENSKTIKNKTLETRVELSHGRFTVNFGL